MMTVLNSDYGPLVDQFTTFALNDDAISAALIMGSQARTNHPADEWSDLDLLLFVSDADAFAARSDWYMGLGDILLSFRSQTPGGDHERRILLASGLTVDFAINSLGMLEYAASHDLPGMADGIFRRGVRVLVDKPGLLQAIVDRPLPPAPVSQPPDEHEFTNLVHNFWFHTLWSARHLRRGELWWSKMACDGLLKDQLVQMLRWHAQAQRGPQVDTWIGGRFIEEWADPRAVAEFGAIYAHYNAADIARALQATMRLFRWVSTETAERWGFDYPDASADATVQMVTAVLAG